MPVIDYIGWPMLFAGVAFAYGRTAEGGGPGCSRLPVLLLLPYYLAAALWSVKSRKPGQLLSSAPSPPRCTRA